MYYMNIGAVNPPPQKEASLTSIVSLLKIQVCRHEADHIAGLNSTPREKLRLLCFYTNLLYGDFCLRKPIKFGK
jgi:hypothetical protein